MISPANVTLSGDRYTPFISTMTLTGLDLTGATIKLQVRDRNDGGTVRADLATVGSIGTEGVTIVSVAAIDGVSVSTLSIRINEATMEAMPLPGTGAEGDAGDDLELVWDIHITPSGGVKQRYGYGPFIVRAGSTQ